ncbi:STAS domain-containing protein [Actinacidiphila yeochonensis]|uniref:STAS domain-containing protein n=1 Tax=Actinacidiphila yeochonensis TaxID=89050 RepID=UPI00056744DD|nr:STAS domain-containing protein [Actinacidiphila yeochonensis]
MQVTQAEQSGWAVVTVTGELDLLSSSAVRQKVHEVVADGRRSLVLDLADVRFCDSSGVGVLIGARRLMRSCAGRLRIVLPEQGAAASTSTARTRSGGHEPSPGAPYRDAGLAHGGRSTRDDGPYNGGSHVNRVLAALGVRRLFDVYADLDAATDDDARPLSA